MKLSEFLKSIKPGKSGLTTNAALIALVLFLGCLIFIDDYFNCLTVGSVMRPVK